MKRRQAMNRDILPIFVEPNRALPFAPNNEAFGVKIGQTLFSKVKSLTETLRLPCKDTSIRELMKRRREALAAKEKAEGKQVDGKSGASRRYRSPRERNPSVRWSCEKIFDLSLPDRPRAKQVKGRLLFVFDSPTHPLRNVSYQYDSLHPPGVRAMQDTVDFYRKKWGKPHQQEGKLPAWKPGLDPKTVMLTKYDVVRYQWKFADIEILLQLRSYGAWVNVLEQIAVPWPVRPDAPSLRRSSSTISTSHKP